MTGTRQMRPIAAALVFSLLMLLRPGYLPVPYVVALIALAAVVLPLAVDVLVQGLGRRTFGDIERSIRRTGRMRITPAALMLAGVSMIAGGAAAWVAPPWFYRVQAAAQVDFDLPYRQAVEGVRADIPRSSTLVVDNVVWTDLEGDGYDGLVWFTKLDADPDVARTITDWRAVDYVVATQIMYTSRESGPTLRALLDNSTVVESWGAGEQRVDLRKVQR